MAKGSHKTWGGWEPRTCWNCGTKLVLARGHAGHHYIHATDKAFSLCCGTYHEAYADMGPAQDVDHADRSHPDQLIIE